MDTHDTDTIVSFEQFSDQVTHENYLLTEQLCRAELKISRLTKLIDKQNAELEARKNKLALVESALTFAEDKNAEHARALNRIKHFVRVEQILMGTLPDEEVNNPAAVDQNYAMAALAEAQCAGSAE